VTESRQLRVVLFSYVVIFFENKGVKHDVKPTHFLRETYS
jgi:hypothetical protein